MQYNYTNSVAPTYVNPPYPGAVLQLGSTGESVRLMQTYLNAIRDAFYPQLTRLTVDGIYGLNTRQCVIDYQALSGLSVDGKIGMQTWNSIVAKYNSIQQPVYPPYPGTVLQLGSRGESVRTMQTDLNAIRQAFYPQLPYLTVDGIYGHATQQCVMTYQALAGLTVDGKIGPQTWNSIVKDYNRIPQQPVVPPYPGAVLQLGSRGESVRTMQTYLNAIRQAYYPQLPYLTVDGIYGTATRQCVIDYQALTGLRIDGRIGQQTWNSIVTKYNSISGGGEGTSWPGYNLTYGSSGAPVRYMQQQLDIIQPVYTAINWLTVDGVFGNNTANAVKRFQAQFGLVVDGIIGANTWNRIVSVSTAVASGQNTRVTTPYPGYVIQVGASGDPVRFVQSYLNHVNTSNRYGWPMLTIDGIFGQNTQAAVMAFQSRFGLMVDGRVGSSTWSALLLAFNNSL